MTVCVIVDRQPAMERRLSAILAADVVGYAGLMERDEKGTHERLVAGRKELFEPEIARHHGRIFKLMGDGILAEFGSVVDAVECAVSLQRGLAERNVNVPEDERVNVRIGINLGEVIVEGDDRYGEGVNIAARLEQLADPGGICVSGKVAREVEKKLSFGFEPMGAQHVKNMAEPVQAYRVRLDNAPVRSSPKVGSRRIGVWQGLTVAAAIAIALGAGGAFWIASNLESEAVLPLPEKPSIAVLPFNNLGNDTRWQHLADAVTEDVITNLAQSKDLFVIAGTSTNVYKGKAVDVRNVGRDLGVKYILEGSVDAAGDTIHITAQLIEAATRNHVWSERYDGAVGDIATIQDDVTRKIAGTITGYEGVVAEADRAVSRRKPPANLQAYDFYLLAMESKHKETKEDNIKAQALFHKAIELDPGFARAYVGLAWSYNYEIMLGYTESFSRSMADQLAASQKALALDPYDGEAHLAVAINYQMSGDYERSRHELQRAFALAPNNADVLLLSAGSYPYLGDPQHALAMADQAIRLNPNYPAWYNRSLLEAYYFAGAFDRALAAAKRIQNPQEWNYVFIAASYAQLGRQTEATSATATILNLDPEFSAEAWIYDPAVFAARDTELNLYLEGVRKAGLPVCATDAYLQAHKDIKPLPGCQKNRVKS